MPNRPALITQAEIARCICAAKQAGAAGIRKSAHGLRKAAAFCFSVYFPFLLSESFLLVSLVCLLYTLPTEPAAMLARCSGVSFFPCSRARSLSCKDYQS